MKKWLMIGLAWGVILAGIVLLPGPGLLIVAGGVYLLSRQLEWARERRRRFGELLRRGRRLARWARRAHRGGSSVSRSRI